METSKKINIIIILFTFLLSLNIFVNRDFDKYYYNQKGNEMQIQGSDDYKKEEAAIYLNDITDKTALIYDTGIGIISNGHYQVELQYASTGGETIFRVYSANYVNKDNTYGKDFVYEVLDVNESFIKIDFEINQDIDDFSFLIETTDENFAVGRITINSYNYVYNDAFIYIALIIAISICLLFIINTKKQLLKPAVFKGKEISSKRYTLLVFFIMLATAFVAYIPYFDMGMVFADDMVFHLARIEGIARGFESGQFPVKVHGGHLNDYGYANGIFYPDLFLYFPAFLRFLDVSLLTAFKIFSIFSHFLTFIISYVSFSKLLKSRNMGLLLACAYVLNLYRLHNLYSRGAIGEYTAMIFLPLVLYGLYAVFYGKRKDWFYLVVGATGVFQSHILTTGITLAFCILLGIIGFKQLFFKEKRIKELLFAIGSALLINLWFILPFLLMMGQLGITVSSRNIPLAPKITEEINVLFSSLFTKTEYSPAESMTYSPIGWIYIFIIGLYIAYRILYKEDNENKRLTHLGDGLLVFSLFSIFLTTHYFAWDFIQSNEFISRIVGAIQFPSRISMIFAVCLTGLLGVTILLWIKDNKYKVMLSVGLVFLMSFQMSIWYDGLYILRKIESSTENKNEVILYMDEGECIALGEYITNGTNVALNLQTPQIITDNETVVIENLEKAGTKMSFNYTADLTSGDTTFIIPYTYIPNYEVKVDGVEQNVIKYDGAKVAFIAPSESGFVEIRYTEPLTFRLAEMISGVSIVGFIGYYYYKKRKIDK